MTGIDTPSESIAVPGEARSGVAMSALTTLRVGGPVSRYIEARTTDAVIEAVATADEAGLDLLVLGGGSNLLVGDDGFDGTVVHLRTSGVEVIADDPCSGATVRVAAGEPWDEVVARAVACRWNGIEALSGIPGSTGATPIQNVGAYGQEIADSVATVRTWDRQQRRVATLAAADCDFAYRTSRLKRERFRGGPRYVVLEVTLQLLRGELSAPVRYAELARTLGVQVGQRAPLGQVRQAVLALRRGKGMVLNEPDHDTWSAGSFFTNPILDPVEAERLPADAPRWPAGGDQVKVSAAWLIEHAGFVKGFGIGDRASLSTKHTLALTNRGAARAADVIALARTVRDGVRQAYGVELVPEPVLVGCRL